MKNPLIAIVTDESRILIGFEKSGNIAGAEREAIRNKAHCFIVKEGWDESIEDRIGQQAEFGYRCRFEHDGTENAPATSLFPPEQTLLWSDLYYQFIT